MIDFFKNTLIGQIIMTLFISMVPVIELRGAIPIATAAGLNFWIAIAVSIIGNLIPVPFIIIFIKKIFAFLRTKSEWLNNLPRNSPDERQGNSRNRRMDRRIDRRNA